MEKGSVVPMRLFANWEMDRTSSSAVQRIFNLSINRLVLNDVIAQIPSIVITAKLQGHKRSLRSNDISIPSNNHGMVDLDLDISFAIQYPHFLKRKRNILQILVQRKRKYKNRPIPGGFKTLAMGVVNLTHLLQQGGLKEIILSTSDAFEKATAGSVPVIGRLFLGVCSSLPLENEAERERDRGAKKAGIGEEMSEDDSDSDFDDLPSDLNEIPSARSNRIRDPRMDRKLAHRKNIKQRVISLLKKFKVPEEEALALSTSSSVARAPTAKELDALFEELEELSDSGPDVGADDVSIGSNPRPALRPFFTRSREVLPAIYDPDGDVPSESDGEADDLEWSSETENAREREKENMEHPGKDALPGTSNAQAPSSLRFGSSQGSGGPMPGSNSIQSMPHSMTTGSISRKDKTSAEGRNINLCTAEQMSSLLAGDLSSSSDFVWLCCLQEAPHTSSLPATTVNCPSYAHVKLAISQIVSKIQNFCNSNSAAPPMTFVGVIGGDKLITQVLRAYVECLQHKSSSNWLHYLRFALLPAPYSLCARLIGGLDGVVDQMCRDVWERWTEMNLVEKTTTTERMLHWAEGGGACVNLAIGEALLQMADKNGEAEASGIFVPFLAEVRVGQQEDELDSAVNSPRTTTVDDSTEKSGGGTSPPNSPHSRTTSSTADVHEMQVEYWLGRENANDSVNSPSSVNTTPNSKKDSIKGTMKSTFKTLFVARSCSQHLLSLSFVKEKKKDKMLHKLGMKKGQKSDAETTPVQIPNVARLLCSSTNKHYDLKVCVDGVFYQGVRYFQTSSQWQTHIKSFPISLISPVVVFSN